MHLTGWTSRQTDTPRLVMLDCNNLYSLIPLGANDFKFLIPNVNFTPLWNMKLGGQRLNATVLVTALAIHIFVKWLFCIVIIMYLQHLYRRKDYWISRLNGLH